MAIKMCKFSVIFIIFLFINCFGADNGINSCIDGLIDNLASDPDESRNAVNINSNK